MPATIDPLVPEDASIFLIGQDFQGRWRVREAHGLAGGTFLSRQAAADFVARSRHTHPGAAIVFAA